MLDIKARNAQFKEECPSDIWNEAKDLLISFL
jgi:mRNA interferase MazF